MTTNITAATLTPLAFTAPDCCQVPWLSRTQPRYGAVAYPDVDAVLRALAPEFKLLPERFLAESPLPDVEYGLDIDAARNLAPWVASPFWPKITHLQLRNELAFEQLHALDLAAVRSVTLESFLEKPTKLAKKLSLPGLRSIRCVGQSPALGTLIAATAHSIESLHLGGGLKPKARAVLLSESTQGLRHLGLNVAASEKELLALFDGPRWPGLRSLDLNGRLTPSVCATVRALPAFRALERLRVAGSDMTAKAAEVLLEPSLPSLVTLEIRNAMTYAGLSKADPNPGLLRVLARSSGLPVKNLILGGSWDVGAIQAFVRAQPLRSLERVYLRHRLSAEVGPSIAAVAHIVAGRVPSLDPTLDVGAAAAWLPLVERGIDVFVYH